ncbi:type II toxin-antitoxin system VapC family toxin [Betaproteobacteria bacterium PRO5]|nr:type II toxin-antitoxin system VapC family toxin [Betaproteobacteria bacterium PRO5]
MSYLIDTNIIAEVRKGKRCDPHVAKWWGQTSDNDLFLSVLVTGEIRKDIELARLRDPTKAARLEQWLNALIAGFAGRILPVDQAVADQWGCLNSPNPRPTVDSLLAATAQVYRLTLVTRNVANMPKIGISILDPFTFE